MTPQGSSILGPGPMPDLLPASQQVSTKLGGFQLRASYGKLHQVLRRSLWDSDCPGPGACVCTTGRAQSPVCVTKDRCLEHCDHDGTDLEKMVKAQQTLGTGMTPDHTLLPQRRQHPHGCRHLYGHPRTFTQDSPVAAALPIPTP